MSPNIGGMKWNGLERDEKKRLLPFKKIFPLVVKKFFWIRNAQPLAPYIFYYGMGWNGNYLKIKKRVSFFKKNIPSLNKKIIFTPTKIPLFSL